MTISELRSENCGCVLVCALAHVCQRPIEREERERERGEEANRSSLYIAPGLAGVT